MIKKIVVALLVLAGAWFAGHWLANSTIPDSRPRDLERYPAASREDSRRASRPEARQSLTNERPEYSDRRLQVTGESGPGVGSGASSGDALDDCIRSAIAENVIAQFRCNKCDEGNVEPSPTVIDIDMRAAVPAPDYADHRWYDRGTDSWVMDCEIFWNLEAGYGRPSGIVFCQTCEPGSHSEPD